MKKYNRYKRILIGMLILLLFATNSLLGNGFLYADDGTETLVEEEAEEETEEETEDVTEELTDEESKRCLFVGNSLTFCSNSPEMLQSMVKEGNGKEITPVLCVYSSKTLYIHAAAINAVIRTKGDSKALTDKERKAFWDADTLDYSDDMYEGYVDAIWDLENERPYRFGTVILQIYYKMGRGDGTAARIAKSIETIINALDSPNTTYVVNVTTGIVLDGSKGFIATQDKIDKTADEGIEIAKKTAKGKYKQLLTAYTGRAYCNYLIKYGENYAQIKEPSAYDIYTNDEWKKGVANDLIYGDRLHPTQLGSYLSAATLYSVLFGNPKNTVKSYRGSVKNYLRLVNGERKDDTNFAKAYRKGKGFLKGYQLTAAAKMAWKTTKNDLREDYSETVRRNAVLKTKKPKLLSIKKTSKGLQISWKPLLGAARYRVYRKINGGVWEHIGTTQRFSYCDNKAKPGRTYSYTVRCANINNTKATSSFNKKGLTYQYQIKIKKRLNPLAALLITKKQKK